MLTSGANIHHQPRPDLLDCDPGPGQLSGLDSPIRRERDDRRPLPADRQSSPSRRADPGADSPRCWPTRGTAAQRCVRPAASAAPDRSSRSPRPPGSEAAARSDGGAAGTWARLRYVVGRAFALLHQPRRPSCAESAVPKSTTASNCGVVSRPEWRRPPSAAPASARPRLSPDSLAPPDQLDPTRGRITSLQRAAVIRSDRQILPIRPSHAARRRLPGE